MIIGREHPANIVVPAPQVSAAHARIEPLGAGVYRLTDLGSSNGTFVNGRRISSEQITLADEVRLGSFRIDLRAYSHLLVGGHVALPALPHATAISAVDGPAMMPAPTRLGSGLTVAIGTIVAVVIVAVALVLLRPWNRTAQARPPVIQAVATPIDEAGSAAPLATPAALLPPDEPEPAVPAANAALVPETSGAVSAAFQRPGVDDAVAQRETLHAIRNLGTALMSWLTDNISRGAAGQDAKPISDYESISDAELRRRLVPQYIEEVPTADGWGHPLDIRVNAVDSAKGAIVAIRSPGADGVYEGDSYAAGAFAPEEAERDIVWEDGFFVRWPQKGT